MKGITKSKANAKSHSQGQQQYLSRSQELIAAMEAGSVDTLSFTPQLQAQEEELLKKSAHNGVTTTTK